MSPTGVKKAQKKKTSSTASTSLPLDTANSSGAENLSRGSDIAPAPSSQADVPDNDFGDQYDTEVIASDYSVFAEAVGIGMVGFFQISKTLFVCEGWDRRRQGTNGHWYHIQVLDGWETIIVCTCTMEKPCLHELFLIEQRAEVFPAEDYQDDVTCQCVLFSRDDGQNSTTSLFSIATPLQPDLLKARAIVQNQGGGTGDGNWICSRDTGSSICCHISAARNGLQQLLTLDSDARDTRDWSELGVNESQVRSINIVKSVSHLAILAPIWAALPEDRELYTRTFEGNTPPTLIKIGSHSRCSCGAPGTGNTTTRPCTIYTITHAVRSTIEVQMCHACSTGRRRYAGPDGRELGLFNYNNTTVFTHDIMDEYTAAFSSSETPFAAWTTVITRRYASSGSTPFVSEQIFRTAWFLYSDLQFLEGDMQCPDCGPYPDDTIWDGVTLAFSRKHVLASLCPPTTILPEAKNHGSLYVSHQTLLVDSDLRKAVRKIVSGPSLVGGDGIVAADVILVEGMDEEEEAAAALKKNDKVGEEKAQRINLIPEVIAQLKNVDPRLGSVFEAYFGLDTLENKLSPPKVYIELFMQIAAEESVLQMVPMPALIDLTRFELAPSELNESRLMGIPALYNVLKLDRQKRTNTEERVGTTLYSRDLLGCCRWIMLQTTNVVARLITPSHHIEKPAAILEDNWQESGAYYSMPQVRLRPRYPRLKHDQGYEGSKWGATCSKFYAQYGQQRLTGGIMCVWCTHSICYGFHCIPLGEGRNDVFSAIVTRWPVAPKRVIYDFACALGPYCMTREPRFFADTQFVIDDFHSFGHTKCSSAAFLKTYAQVDPRLGRINSSAGECGNGGIGRIRKAVSYMSQGRAIRFTQKFVAIWNRVIIRKRRRVQ
ncbi:hypothetical protein B0H11DRAFT_1745441 [Mycena galericulata]|nr:hypothetical protein B0H11DRAFT_1745441 [Mycena galericulata]